MTNAELQRILAKLIFTTSDKGAMKINEWFDVTPQMHEHAMKEYIYLKAIIVGYLCHTATSDIDEAQYIFMGAIDNLGEILDKFESQPYITYGCTSNELNNVILYYFKRSDGNHLDSLCKPFIERLGTEILFQSNTPNLGIKTLINLTESDLRNNLIKLTKPQKAGCGCLSTVACLSLIVIFFACF